MLTQVIFEATIPNKGKTFALQQDKEKMLMWFATITHTRIEYIVTNTINILQPVSAQFE